MGTDRRFTPIYRDICEEPAIYDDDALLATWLRLRLTADAAWPDPAMLPRSVSDAHVTVLEEMGKIHVLGRDQYRFRGVDLDRTRKSEAGRFAALVRWEGHAPALPPQSTRNAPALPLQYGNDAEPMPTETETETETLDSFSQVGKRARHRTEVRGFTGPLG
jgi:hypothetical protein